MNVSAAIPTNKVFSGRIIAILLISALPLLAGCPPQKISDWSPIPGKTSVSTIAKELGLQITEVSSAYVTMRNSANIVTVYSDPGGRAYVNGQSVGPVGGYVVAGNVLYVPDRAEGAIRSAMRNPSRPPIGDPPPKIKPEGPPPGGKLTLARGRVVIDAGHGGKDSGTTSGGRLPEKTINIAVALAVAEGLRKRGVEAVCTRTDDHFVELDERVAIANRSGGRLFVSIHADSAKSTDTGHTIITPEASAPEAVTAAHVISNQLVSAGFPQHSVRKDVRGLRVLRGTRIPAILIELGFLSNPHEAARLCDHTCQMQMADAIAEGIARYLAKKY